ncbi:hypothetical protein LAWI1_G002834 [Lachnellula willkommii]|uniref:Sec39 domain-containing protein n=1 Tax=Lachnellula willkommii TaxID=215461 RepID=A0A559M9C4_9HELO|nr:hypothetical protein LAWI1_G002834 [Lachnellula willkommii]
MAGPQLSPAKAILLAVQLATKADIPTLQSLIAEHSKTLHRELVLRILLSHLPETVESSKYVSLLEDLVSGGITEDSKYPANAHSLAEMSEVEAQKKVRKLHLLHLKWPYAPDDDPADPFFELLDDKAGVNLLLSRTGKEETGNETKSVGRDLRGLIGPWMYGDSRWKRRKLHRNSEIRKQVAMPMDDSLFANERCVGWEEVFQWVTTQAAKSWKTAVEAVEQWDGPGDSDLGSYGDGIMWLDENDQQHLERRYARAAIASAYLISEESIEALNGADRILSRIITLMDQDRTPTLQAAAALLSPVFDLGDVLSEKNALHLRNDLLSDRNILTSPNETSLRLLHALLVSTYICMKTGHKLTIRRAGELALLQNEQEQGFTLSRLMMSIVNGPKEDDKYWIRVRNELLWLRSWGAEELSEGADATKGRGILGKLSQYLIETEILKTLLKNTRRYRLVFKQGEPFKPVSLRVHGDPISIIGKVLEQNPKSYAKINDFIEMGQNMVKAGLVARSVSGHTKPLDADQAREQESIAEKRVVSMCIDASLVEDDFETAYSYVVIRLRNIAGPAQARTPEPANNESGLFANVPAQAMDDWSWRAALQAGKYRRTTFTTKPSHLGNASGNPEIRHLEQRMECLAQALRLAPKATLPEIINVFRRCEEELETHVKQEAEQEAAWDAQGDDQAMPGGFAATPMRKNATAGASRAAEEAPLSLLDLSVASAARAQRSLAALSVFRGNGSGASNHNAPLTARESNESSRVATPDSAARNTMRKRDQLKNAAVGGLASGIGWLLNAPPVRDGEEDEDAHHGSP